MKALTLHQPWATLVALGVKTIETRSWPAPKSIIGQHIAIHAGMRTPFQAEFVGDYDVLPDGGRPTRYWLRHGPTWHRLRSECSDPDATAMLACLFPDKATAWFVSDLPLGYIVATARVKDSVPMMDADEKLPVGYAPDGDVLFVGRGNIGDGTHKLWLDRSFEIDRTDQLPYGDFQPGRWAWLLDDIQLVTPSIRAKGKQRVWEWTP